MNNHSQSLVEEQADQKTHIITSYGHRIEIMEQHLRDAADRIDQLTKQVVEQSNAIAGLITQANNLSKGKAVEQ